MTPFPQCSWLLSTAAVLVLAACGGSAGDSTAAGSDRPAAGSSVRPSAEVTVAAPTPAPASSSAAPAGPRFGPDMVRKMLVTKKAKGGQANAVVVASGTPTQLLDVGKGCVEHFRRTYKAAFCYVFGSQADFAVTTWNEQEGLVDKCWIWYVGIPLAGGDYMPMEMGGISYQQDRCPGKVYPKS